MEEMRVRSLGWEDPLEQEMAAHSSIFAWESHGQRSLAGYSPWGCETVRHNEKAHTHTPHTQTQTHRHTHTDTQIYTHTTHTTHTDTHTQTDTHTTQTHTHTYTQG